MSGGGKNSMRWLETTSLPRTVTPAVATNIPSRRLSSVAQEDSASVAEASNVVGAVAIVKNSGCDSAHSRKMKTQIAKISYAPHEDRTPPKSTKSYVRPMTTMIQRIHLENTTPPPTPPSSHLKETTKCSAEEYAKKKDEREKEIHEIQEMLQELTSDQPPRFEVINETSSLKETTANTVILKETVELALPMNTETNAKPIESETIHSMPAQIEESVKSETSLPSTALKTIFQRSKTDYNLMPAKSATIRRRKSVRAQPTGPRSKSTQLPETKSSELLPVGSQNKKKSYNPEEARRFMEEQRKKRRTFEVLSTNRSQQQKITEKEQIKRRLEELHKNTRKIVSKNLKNAQKRTGTGTAQVAAAGEASPNKSAKIDTIVFKGALDRKNQQNKSQPVERTKKLTGSIVNSENLGLEIVRKSDSGDIDKKPELKDGSKSVQLPSALTENQKRVGLLRKAELKDHSFSAIKEFSFDKENVALDLLTPKLTAPLESGRIKDKLTQSLAAPNNTLSRDPTMENLVSEEQIEAPKQGVLEIGNDQPIKSNFSSNELQLEIPSGSLHTRPLKREQATQLRESLSLMALDSIKSTNVSAAYQMTAHNERADLPYWLKPSAVQVYPYNFIMAVRRKLEAITNPPQQPTFTITNIENKATSTSDYLYMKKTTDTPLSSMPKERQLNVKRRLMAANEVEDNYLSDFDTQSREDTSNKQSKGFEKSSKQMSESKEIPLLKSQTLSDVTSNFSSISLLMPVTNTSSEVSSIKSDSKVLGAKSSDVVASHQGLDDDTTISSSIFNSPEKQLKSSKRVEAEFKVPQRPVSPLSLERIEHLKITSKGKDNKTKNHVTAKHDNCEEGSEDKISSKDEKEVTPPEVEIDFNQLLQDFNRSLSQVIEVNEQLKSTLDKSHQIFSPKTKNGGERATDEYEYTSDFEGGSSENVADTKTNLNNLDKNTLQQCKKNLFEMTYTVKPLQSSSKSNTGTESEASMDQKENLDINLDSVSISSAANTTQSKTILSSWRVGGGASGTSHTSSADSLDKRLQSIEDLKESLKESIMISKANRKELQIESKRLIHNLAGSPKKKNKSHSRKSSTQDKEEIAEESVEKYNSFKENQLIKTLKTKENEEWQKVTTEKQSPPKQPKRANNQLSTVHVDSPTVSSNRSLLSDNGSASSQDYASAESPGAAVILSVSPIAEKSYHKHSKSKAPQTKNEDKTLSKISPVQKSTEFEDKSISEDIQNVEEMPNKQNKNGNNNTPSSSAKSSPQKSKQDAFIKVHVNRSRGDFLLPADENTVSNESHFQDAAAANSSETDSAVAPPSYKAENDDTPPKLQQSAHSNISTARSNTFQNESLKQTLGREFVAVFNQSDMEISIVSSHNGSISERSLNYSSVGLYEKLIQKETTKSEHLTLLLKMREKALLDRTKGQIAWLEVQKERYKAKGLLMQITAIKKKQRGILLKMEKEREEIKRLLQSTTSTTSTHSSARYQHHHHHSTGQQQTSPSKRKRTEPRTAPPLLPPLPILSKSTRISATVHHQQQQISTAHSAPIVRANYELESSRTLEELLQKREADLRKRREHVERLILWHQRLDQEEAEVQQLELMLLNYNNAQRPQHEENSTSQPQHQPQTARSSKSQLQEQTSERQKRDGKMERRLKEIEKSLRELSTISISNNSATSTDESATTDTEYVRTSGNKLNKLWRRLTAQQVERFDATRRYKLCKTDLERLYEEAKIAVLRDFAQDEERVAVELLDKTTTTTHIQSSLQQSPTSGANNHIVVVPSLHLNSSSGQSDPEDSAMLQICQEEQSSVEAASTHSTTLPPTPLGDNYSPSAAEEDLIRQESGGSNANTSASSSDSYTQNEDTRKPSTASLLRHRDRLLERNVQKFMELTQRFNNSQQCEGLQRSLSDTQIAENASGGSKKSNKNAALSQRNIAYYGVKTQKRPSKVVNVEIANSLSSASSILTAASTLRSVQSIKTQSNTACSGELEEFSNDSKALNSEAEVAANYNIPLPTNSARDSLDSIPSEDGVYDILPSKESAVTTNLSASPSTSPKSASSIETQSNAAPLSKDVNRRSDAQAKHISAKLDEISLAVAKLSQSNSVVISGTPPRQQSEHSTKCSKSENKTDFSTLSAENDDISNVFGDRATQITAGSVSYSYSFEAESTGTQSPDAGTIQSKSSSTSITSISSPPQQMQSQKAGVSETLSETMLIAQYETDFEDSVYDDKDETRLEDESLPQFETTFETTQEEDEKDEEKQQFVEILSTIASPKAPVQLSAVSENLPPPPMPPPPPLPAAQLASTSREASGAAAATLNSNTCQSLLMPDIINELEQRRCQQQIHQYEHVTAVPYNMYVREIPNKPPPPYVPPAHGSPMTTIFPAEERIKDLTYRRTHELYCEILKTEYTNDMGEKLPSVLAEKITNIYERIILDICREYLDEHQEVLNNKSDPCSFHSNLAFFNPPDRLCCLQTFVYKEVRRCLAMDKIQPKRTQVYSVYGQRAKRDHIGKIIIQEMYDEDDKWCNFHHEEAEVLDLIFEEMLGNMLSAIAKDVLIEEGGTVHEDIAEDIEEIAEQTTSIEQTSQQDESLYDKSITSTADAAVTEEKISADPNTAT